MFFKSKKALATGMLLSMMAFAAAGCGGGDKKAEAPKKDAPKVYNVGIVQIVEHQALDDSRKGFIEGMKKKGFEEGKNVKYDAQNAQGDQSNLQTIAQRFVNNKVDLICALSTPAAQTMANATKTIPIVGNDIRERFDMIIDLNGNRLYLKPNNRFSEPFKSPVHGFSYIDRSHTLGCWIVNCLYTDSNAENAGLRNGDRINKINGRDVGDITLEEQKHLFDNLDSVTLTVLRESSTVEIAFPFDNPKI